MSLSRGNGPLGHAVLKEIITDLRFPDMQDLVEHLHFRPDEGAIWLGEKRMLLLHAETFGTLREELLETLGAEVTRGLLTRLGYQSGTRDADLAIKTRINGSELDILAAGAQLHALRGMVRVEPIRIEADQNKGYLYGEFTWTQSLEGDQHVALRGHSHDPACWMEVGYTSGFLTRLMGKRILVREVQCRAQGDETCRAIARPVEDWESPEEDLKYFQPRSTDHHNRSPLAEQKVNPAPRQPKAPFGLEFVTQDTSTPDRPVGNSAAYISTLHKILRVANTNASVLLLGESGVGKTLFAHEVHANSQRANKSFVEINCAAIPEQLIESELFGVQRGAYSGATEPRPGRFEIADGGTILLDEIGTLSMTAQGKLLRVLQSGELERLGSNKTVKVDVRVIAATNENLAEAVKNGRFRGDLFYRLNVFPVTIAPLRERKDDLPPLLDNCVHKLSRLHGRNIPGITPRALQRILDYNWPGNIREFENVIERAVILADDGDTLDIRHLSGIEEAESMQHSGTVSWDQAPSIGIRLPADEHIGVGTGQQKNISHQQLLQLARSTLQRGPIKLTEIEEVYIEEAMRMSDGNVSKAATLLGLSRAQLDYRLKKTAVDHSQE
jgi:transcriptional regulator with GAF, ATPase, and Fis domain